MKTIFVPPTRAENNQEGVPMKSEKGETTVDSADEVPAGRTSNTTEKQGQDEGPSDFDSSSDYPFDEATPDQAKKGWFHGKGILIAAIAGIGLLVIGILMFRGGKCCGRK